MKRTIIAAAVLALGAAGAGVSFADPYPNGNNDYGLCKAYTAHGDSQPKPFEEMATAWEAANEGDETFAEFCATVLAGDGSPGNSEHGHGKKG
ncbi:MAG: hypothetical protein JJD92_06715 [Frankiaceae bacterium]|nr:hypothetical protein [Frankiaceae bacterium]